jgi:hypothetical protein
MRDLFLGSTWFIIVPYRKLSIDFIFTYEYGNVTVLKQWPNQNLSPKSGASNQVQRIIGQKLFMKSDINFIRQFSYQTEFLPISKRQFETSELMRILNIRHVISK